MVSLADIYACRGQLAPAVLSIPSLLTEFDRCAYAYAIRHLYRGAGLVIDAGTFLGGTTAILADGMRARLGARAPGPHERIVALDAFVFPSERLITQYRRHRARAGLGEGPAGIRPGDSFRAEFDANLAGHADLLEVVEGDILGYGHDGRPVELLCLDVCKAPDVAYHCARTFFPALIPGASYVLHQDHIHGNLPFNHILFELFADKLVRVQEDVATAIFRVDSAISAGDVAERLGAGPEDFFHSGQEAEMRRAAERAVGPRSALFLQFALAAFFRDFGAIDKAREHFTLTLLSHRSILSRMTEDEITMIRNYYRKL